MEMRVKESKVIAVGPSGDAVEWFSDEKNGQIREICQGYSPGTIVMDGIMGVEGEGGVKGDSWDLQK